MSQSQPPRSPFFDAVMVYIACVTIVVALKRCPGVEFIQRNLLFFAALVFLSLPAIALRYRDESMDSFGMQSRSAWREVLFVVAVAALIFPPFAAGYHVYQKIWFHNTPRFDLPPGMLRLAAIHLLLVALPEEFFYRGYLQEKLIRVFPGGFRFLGAPIGPAILIASGLFALGHFVVDFRPMRLGVFFPALLFGWMKEKTGTITAPILFHALSNVFMTTLEKSYFGR